MKVEGLLERFNALITSGPKSKDLAGLEGYVESLKKVEAIIEEEIHAVTLVEEETGNAFKEKLAELSKGAQK